jgi:hypothetical protein
MHQSRCVASLLDVDQTSPPSPLHMSRGPQFLATGKLVNAQTVQEESRLEANAEAVQEESRLEALQGMEHVSLTHTADGEFPKLMLF